MKYAAAYVAEVVPASGSQPDAELFYFRHELGDTKAGMAAAKVSLGAATTAITAGAAARDAGPGVQQHARASGPNKSRHSLYRS
jgi:hypothetical protein